MKTNNTSSSTPSRLIDYILILGSRSGGFLLTQILLALLLFVLGRNFPWYASGKFWPVAAIGGALVTYFVMRFFLRREGQSMHQFYRFQRETVGKDIFATLGILLLSAPISYLPNVGLASLLFDNPEATLGILVRPLPIWALVLTFLFPIAIGLTEIPFYFGFVMPRMQRKYSKTVALLVPAIFLSFQHVFLPLIFNPAFIAWRALMFLPFAIFIGLIMVWRPRLLPYIVIIHILMDMSMAIMFLV